MGNTSKLLIVDGEPLPGINYFKVDLEDIDSENSNRDEEGKLHRQPLRKNVMKVAITAIIPSDEIAIISKKISEDTFEGSVFCPLHPDAKNNYMNGTFYISRKSIQLLSLREGYWTLSFNAVEV